MTGKTYLSISAFVSENERKAVKVAAERIAQALSQAASAPWTCDWTFQAELESPPKKGEASIMVTSLLPELERIKEPWTQTEKRLRAAYGKIAERGLPVFICTILRRVGNDVDSVTADALMVRIRRLNLLAAEISHETGASVIDLDRVLADIGARRLQTDHRLGGEIAAEMAGHTIAMTLTENALDAFIPYETQDAVREILARNRPVIPADGGSRDDLTIKKGFRSMGLGRRKQVVLPVVYTDRQLYVGRFLQQVVRGKVGPGEMWETLTQAVRHHGLGGTIVLLASSLSKQIPRKK